METYLDYKNKNIDPSVLGFETGDDKSDYITTTKGAKIIGWAGVDGIHFCFIKNFGNMFSP